MKSLPNLLIVDDNLLQLKHLEIVLKKLKVNLIKAESGFDALEKTKGLELALAIIDVRMPEMNGYELVLKMNEKRSGSKVPVIFLTAVHFNKMEVFKGYGSGAVDYLFKPVDNQILLCKVNVFLDLFIQKQTVIRDATLLKKSADNLTRINAALKKSEEKYRNVVELANDGICIIQDGIIKYLNRRLANMWSSTVEEIIDTPFSDYIDPICQREMADRYKQRISGKDIQAYEITLIRKDGSKLCVEVKGTVINYKGKPADMIIARDITERKGMEEVLRESENRYRTLAESSIDNIFIINRDDTVRFVNSHAAVNLHFRADEIIGKPRKNFFPPDIAERQGISLQKVFETGEPFRNEDKILFGNQEFWQDSSLVPLKDETGNVTAVIGIARDITEHKQAAETLRRKDEHYKAIIENIFKFIPEGVLVFTESMSLLKQNKAFGDIIRKYAPVLEYTEEELAQKIIEQLSSEIPSGEKGEKMEIRISKKSQ